MLSFSATSNKSSQLSHDPLILSWYHFQRIEGSIAALGLSEDENNSYDNSVNNKKYNTNYNNNSSVHESKSYRYKQTNIFKK